MSFIVIEGCDRVGKSTQVEMLVARMRRGGGNPVQFSFPDYESPTGKIIDAHLHDGLMLSENVPGGGSRRSVHDALSFQCVQTCDKYAAAPEIKRHLSEGKTVVCGRWWQSAFVYGLDDGLDPDWLRRVHDCLPKPDINILLDFDSGKAAHRAGEPGDRYEKDLAKQIRLRELYLSLWQGHSERGGLQGWLVVPAVGTKEQVHARLFAEVARLLRREWR